MNAENTGLVKVRLDEGILFVGVGLWQFEQRRVMLEYVVDSGFIETCVDEFENFRKNLGNVLQKFSIVENIVSRKIGELPELFWFYKDNGSIKCEYKDKATGIQKEEYAQQFIHNIDEEVTEDSIKKWLNAVFFNGSNCEKRCEYIYFSPVKLPQLGVKVHVSEYWGVLTVNAEKKIDEETLRRVQYLAQGAVLKRLIEDWFRLSIRSHIRNAMTSIMSRNMSHNIGSHVLSRLAFGESLEIEELEKSPSDVKVGVAQEQYRQQQRKLWNIFRYLQMRQDFLAQIASEWFSWAESASMLRHLMREFLVQEVLLDHIAGAEGLTAWRYTTQETRN